MGDRVHADNILWVCFCCGCLPFFGLLKTAIVIVPVTLGHFLPITLISILFVPYHFIYVYKTICKTPQYGINLKILAILLTPPLIFAWPPIVALGALMVGLVWSIGGAQYYTFDDKYNLLYGGIGKMIEDTFDHIKSFWKSNNEFVDDFLSDLEAPLRDGEEPFDIRVIDIIVGLFISIIGFIIDVPAVTIISIISYCPITFKAYLYYFEHLGKAIADEPIWVCACFPFVIMVFALIPVGSGCYCIGIIFWASIGGVLGAIEAYNEGVPAGFKRIFKLITEIAELSINFVTDDLD